MKWFLKTSSIIVITFLLGCNSAVPKKYINRANEAYDFCKSNGYNTEYCFLVDFSQNTQIRRFYVYDFEKKKVVYRCYCAHGNDGTSKSLQANKDSFSNKIGSHKSSLGKYRVGKRRTINSVDGMFDVSMLNVPCYEVHGLEKTNSNAHKRGILIHPMPGMDSNWLVTLPGVSLGCFSIGRKAFDKIASYIDRSSKPVLLWAFYE